MKAIVWPDRGVGIDPEPLGLAFHHQGSTSVTSLGKGCDMGVMICFGQGGLLYLVIHAPENDPLSLLQYRILAHRKICALFLNNWLHLVTFCFHGTASPPPPNFRNTRYSEVGWSYSMLINTQHSRAIVWWWPSRFLWIPSKRKAPRADLIEEVDSITKQIFDKQVYTKHITSNFRYEITL